MASERGIGQVQDPGAGALRRQGPREGPDDHRIHRPGQFSCSQIEFNRISGLFFISELGTSGKIYPDFSKMFSILFRLGPKNLFWVSPPPQKNMGKIFVMFLALAGRITGYPTEYMDKLINELCKL